MKTRFLDLFRAVSFVVLLAAAATVAVAAVVHLSAAGHSQDASTYLLIFFTLCAVACFLLAPIPSRGDVVRSTEVTE